MFEHSVFRFLCVRELLDRLPCMPPCMVHEDRAFFSTSRNIPSHAIDRSNDFRRTTVGTDSPKLESEYQRNDDLAMI